MSSVSSPLAVLSNSFRRLPTKRLPASFLDPSMLSRRLTFAPFGLLHLLENRSIFSTSKTTDQSGPLIQPPPNKTPHSGYLFSLRVTICNSSTPTGGAFQLFSPHRNTSESGDQFSSPTTFLIPFRPDDPGTLSLLICFSKVPLSTFHRTFLSTTPGPAKSRCASRHCFFLVFSTQACSIPSIVCTSQG